MLPIRLKSKLKLHRIEKIFFVNQLSKILFYKALSFTDLSIKCELASATVHRMFKYKEFTPKTTRKILKGLEISMDEFLLFSLPISCEEQD
jgi:DNA-binding Xre family transcriptional regulator